MVALMFVTELFYFQGLESERVRIHQLQKGGKYYVPDQGVKTIYDVYQKGKELSSKYRIVLIYFVK